MAEEEVSTAAVTSAPQPEEASTADDINADSAFDTTADSASGTPATAEADVDSAPDVAINSDVSVTAEADAETDSAPDVTVAAEAEATTTIKPPPSREDQIREMASAWAAADANARKATVAKLAAYQASFDAGQDKALVKAQLVGTWKLLIASDADRITRSGLSGLAPGRWASVVGQFQTMMKPDPLAFLDPGAEKFFMKTVEVIANTAEGTSTSVTLKGGFDVGVGLKTEFGVVEYYSRQEVGAKIEDKDFSPNRWNCAYLSETLRVCTLADGSVRVYEKVEQAEALAEAARLLSLKVAVDPAAAEEEERLRQEAAKAAEEEEEYDDPNIPAWQKRIDKMDGTKRTKNGTPIINHGADRFGSSGPNIQQ